MYLGLDIGGTNTDAVIINKHQVIASIKIPTCYEHPESSITEALRKLFYDACIKPAMITQATFSSTLAINTILQQQHDAVGLVLAAGPGLNPHWSSIGNHVFLTSAKLDHRGTELTHLNTSELHTHIQKWKEEGINTFACVSKFSTRNPQHEHEIKNVILNVFKKDSQKPIISLGHKLSGSLNFPRRITTAYWNSSIWRIHNNFIAAIKKTLKKFKITAPTFLLKADGGTIPLYESYNTPIESIHSGPAASIMGILALYPTQDDCFILDVGGTTTEISLLAHGQPLLAPSGLVIKNRPTLIRSLFSYSLPIGGDSSIEIQNTPKGIDIRVGPIRHGFAMAFGGSQPTLTDCLNVKNYSQTGNIHASFLGLKKISEKFGLSIDDIINKVITLTQKKIAAALEAILSTANSQPIHTLEGLTKQIAIHPKSCILTGGAAKSIIHILQKHLTIPIIIPPKYTSITNALGAALTKPTANIELFASTEKGICMIPSHGIKYSITKTYTLEQACQDASKHLLSSLKKITHQPSTVTVEIITAQEFSVLTPFGEKHKEFRVSCQVKPELIHTLY